MPPSSFQYPASIYGFGGLAIGSVKANVPPFSDAETMIGWSLGVAADVQITPAVSVGVKYRHFDLGNHNFSVFSATASTVSERGDAVTGTLSWYIPILQ